MGMNRVDPAQVSGNFTRVLKNEVFEPFGHTAIAAAHVDVFVNEDVCDGGCSGNGVLGR